MPGPKPPAVPLSEAERQALHTMLRAHKTPQHLSFRAHVILLLAEGLTAPDVARRHDAPRPGAPATFSAEQWCQIIALACEPPEASGRPISHWTPRERADEARQRGIVGTISKRHVARFLPSGRSQAAPEALADVQMADLTTLYGQAPALGEAGERGLSTDERTGIQKRWSVNIPLGSWHLGKRSDASANLSGVAP